MFVFSAGQPGRLSRGTFVRRSGRRIRTSYTDDQLTKLEEVCSKQRYMTGTEKMLLASALRLTQTQDTGQSLVPEQENAVEEGPLGHCRCT